MAVLQNIREKCGVLVIVIVGVALLAFLLGDLLSSGRLGRSNDQIVGEIEGEEVDYNKFNEAYNKYRNHAVFFNQGKSLPTQYEMRLNDVAWNELIDDQIFAKYYEEIGIDVTEEELNELMYDPDQLDRLSPVIKSDLPSIARLYGLNDWPRDSVTNRYVTSDLEKVFENLGFTDYYKDVVKRERLSSKYYNMISMGLYTPKAIAKMEYEDMASNVDFVYAYGNYASIKDDEISINDNDLRNYYNKYKSRYVVDKEERLLKYVTFDIVPSANDTAIAKNTIEGYRNELKSYNEDEISFAKIKSDTRDDMRGNYKDGYYLTENEALKIGFDSVFFTSEAGTISDIFESNGYLVFGKIVDVATRPDTVNISSITFKVANDTLPLEVSKSMADSIADILMTTNADSATFASYVEKYSVLPGEKEKGGLYGDFTEGLIEQYNEAFFSNYDSTYQVIENNGTVQLFRINSYTTPERKVKLAIVDKEIRYSDETNEAVYDKAADFHSKCGDGFEKIVSEQKLVIKDSYSLTAMSPSAFKGMSESREVVRWAFEEGRSEGDIADDIYRIDDKYVVVQLSRINGNGYKPIDEVKAEIESGVKRQKKAEKMIKEMKGMSMEAIAEKYGTACDTARNINYFSYIPGRNEPNVIATAFGSKENVMSAPIEGESGVYVIKVIGRKAAPGKDNYDEEKLKMMGEYMQFGGGQMREAIIKNLKIEDNRVKFF